MSSLPLRKEEHIYGALAEGAYGKSTTGLENFYFSHEALPEINVDEIDGSVEFCQRRLPVPLMISSMTGGMDLVYKVKALLAEVAETFQIPIGLGSARIALQNPSYLPTFKIRDKAPHTQIFVNLGAIQLKEYGAGVSHVHELRNNRLLRKNS